MGIVGIFITLIFILFFVRLFAERQVDDVSPGIPCDLEILEKADVYYVIPLFENGSIGDNSEWCGDIKNRNKTLALHGLHHYYHEFEGKISEEDFEDGIREFEDCFNSTPLRFKAPQLVISSENRALVESFGIEVDGKLNQIFHKVYHCGDTGRFSNRFIDWF